MKPSMRPSVRGFALTVAFLAVTAGVAAVDLSRVPRAGAAEAFHRLTGGLGMGPGLDFAGCAAAFDPRIEGVCEDHLDPVPGCDLLCPHRGYHHAQAR